MTNFLISFNVVFPIFIMMALGYFMKSIHLVNAPTVKQMNAVVFKIFLPLLIFKNVYESNISDVFNPKLILFSIGSVVVIIATMFLIIPQIEKDNTKRGVLIQAIFRSNFVIFGVPVSMALCSSGVAGSAAVLIALIIPIYNFFAVVSLEVFNTKKAGYKKVLLDIITNPLIIGSAIGLLFLFTGMKLPKILEISVADISKIATPLALIMLGASINFSAVSGNVRQLVIGILGKLVLIPAIFLSISIYVFGFSGSELAILLALFATPPAVSSFTMAQQMGADDELAGQLVMFGTVLCVLTMFIWIFVVKQLGLL